MSSVVTRIILTLIKIPFIVAILYLCLNVYGFFFAYYNVTSFMLTVEELAMQNNGIPEEYMSSISAMMEWVNNPGSGYTYDSSTKTFKPTSSITGKMFDNLALTIRKPGEAQAVTITASTHSIIPDNYFPAPFGSYLELVCGFNYHWLTPLKIGNGADAEASGQTVMVAGGLDGDSDDMLDKKVVILTQGEERILRIHLAYRVPCLRYYPGQ